MPLSFSTITIGVSRPPAFSSASKFTPPVIAPSPTTATTRGAAPAPPGAAPLAGCPGSPRRLLLPYPLHDAHRIADRGRGVAGAHDVVDRLLAGAKRCQ